MEGDEDGGRREGVVAVTEGGKKRAILLRHAAFLEEKFQECSER